MHRTHRLSAAALSIAWQLRPRLLPTPSPPALPRGGHHTARLALRPTTRPGAGPAAQPQPQAPTISAIAQSVGFKDPSHFSRAFRTRYGISPARYRRTAATPASGKTSAG
ncbi:helix-turn-helix domain-containing protein [Nonomuraea sp. SYSU D8015]|uniref:helix-turn-helix domain-containing protein n=1 Tax=Nonomuraea sp. SYSU D8015 TaxID=2593644 RepID=UPI0016610DDA